MATDDLPSGDPAVVVRGGWRFRPRLWPTVIALVVLAVLLGLGTWQLERRAWKTALIAQLHSRSEAAAVVLPARIDDAAAWAFRRVRVVGRLVHDREMPLTGRVHAGQVGYHLVTPLHRTDLPEAPAVLVDRGWVPADRLDPATRPGSRPGGTVAVSGIVMVPAERGWFRPDNDPAHGLWYWIDPPAMAAWAGIGPVAPIIIEASAEVPTGGGVTVEPGARAGEGSPVLPIPEPTLVEPPNDHLQYALTWYSLAAALIVVYAVSQTRRSAAP